MNPIQEKIEKTENNIAEVIPTEKQKQYVEKYLEIINSKLDECAEFVSSMNTYTNFDYAINSAKASLEHSNPQTLYSLTNTLLNFNYKLPVECDNIFMDSANAIYGNHQLSQYTEGTPMYSDTHLKLMEVMGTDTTGLEEF